MNVLLCDDIECFLKSSTLNEVTYNFIMSLALNGSLQGFDDFLEASFFHDEFVDFNHTERKFVELLLRKYVATGEELIELNERVLTYRETLAELRTMDESTYQSDPLYSLVEKALFHYSIGESSKDWYELLRKLSPIYSIEKAVDIKSLFKRLDLIKKNNSGFYRPVRKLEEIKLGLATKKTTPLGVV